MTRICLAKMYLIEINIDNAVLVGRVAENAGAKNEGMFRDVIENKGRKNVRFTAFHDVDEKKRVTPPFPRC